MKEWMNEWRWWWTNIINHRNIIFDPRSSLEEKVLRKRKEAFREIFEILFSNWNYFWKNYFEESFNETDIIYVKLDKMYIFHIISIGIMKNLAWSKCLAGLFLLRELAWICFDKIWREHLSSKAVSFFMWAVTYCRVYLLA